MKHHSGYRSGIFGALPARFYCAVFRCWLLGNSRRIIDLGYEPQPTDIAFYNISGCLPAIAAQMADAGISRGIFR